MITVDSILAHGPCWYLPHSKVVDAEAIRAVIGDGMEWPQFLQLALAGTSRLSCDDAIWYATRKGVLPDVTIKPWLDVMVARAIRRSLGQSGCSSWGARAEKWLSGEDRSEAAWSAEAAAEAAEAAWSEAAWSAAEAAAWAARSAARSARVAECDQQVRDLLAIIEKGV